MPSTIFEKRSILDVNWVLTTPLKLLHFTKLAYQKIHEHLRFFRRVTKNKYFFYVCMVSFWINLLNNSWVCSNRSFCLSYLADCPAGTRYDGVSKCEDCPLHSYQDQPAQTRCKPCPKDHVTKFEKAVGISQCKG